MQESFHQSRQSAGCVVSWITEKLDKQKYFVKFVQKNNCQERFESV